MSASGRRLAQVLGLLAAALASVAVWIASRDEPPARRSVLIVTVDTLRADHLSCYGYDRATTPEIDRLAADAVLFEQVSTPRPKTAPSMTSLLTGLYPHEHGVRTNTTTLPGVRLALDPGAPLRPDPVSPGLLAERLSAEGLATGAFVSNYVLTRESGLGRGFATYDDELTSTELNRPEIKERKAADNTDRAIAWLREHADEPFFLWVHYIDPHGAYAPPAEHDVFHGPPGSKVPLEALRKVLIDRSGLRLFVAPHNVLRAPDGNRVTDLQRYVDLYDGEIHYVDAQVGRLLGALRDQGRIDDTLVAFTADHGESLGEHALYFEHGYYLYDACLRIPLVVRLPDATPGRRVGEQVDLLDLHATVLEWLGLAPDRASAGRSLIPILRGGPGDPTRIAFSERNEFGFVMRAARTPEWKLIYDFETPSAVEWPLPHPRELYDLRADPGETRNLYDASDARTAEARERLGAALTSWIESEGELRSSAGADREQVESLAPERRAQLEAMGYTGSDLPASDGGGASALAARAPPDTDDPRAILEWGLGGGAEMRALALEGLARHGNLPPAELVLYLDAAQPVQVRARAAELCGERGFVETVGPVRAAHDGADASDASFRLSCAYALERLGKPLASDELAAGTRHWNAGVRALAAWYAGKLADEKHVAALEPLTKDPVGPVRVLAWQALARAKRDGALAALLASARDKDAQIVQAAVLALIEAGASEDLRPLVRELRDDDSPFLQDLGEELAVWTSPGEAAKALAARKKYAPTLRRKLVNAAGATADPSAREALARALRDDDAEVRVIAALHLMRRDAPR